MQASSHQPHEQDSAARGGEPRRGDCPSHLGSHGDQSLHHGGPECGKGCRPHGADEEGFAHELARAANKGERVGDRLCQHDNKRQLASPDQGLAQYSRSRTYEDRKIQGVSILRDPEELRRVGSSRASPSRQPGPGACAVREVVQQQAEEPGDERLPGRPGGATIPELYGGHSRTRVDRCIDYPLGQGILEPCERQGQCVVDYNHETQDPDGSRRDQEDGGRDGPQGSGGDSRPRDEVGDPEGQGQDRKRQVNAAQGSDRNEDTEKEPDSNNVLETPPRDEGPLQSSEVGGRKCCPELPRDCFFSELEFVKAYRDKHEVCVIDFDPGDLAPPETDEDHDLFYDVPDEGEGLEVYECKEFTFEDRVGFAYDSGDFAFSTCQELLEDAFNSVLRGGGGRSNIIDGAKNSVVLGQYVYGGMSGVTKAVVNHTALTRYLNHFVAAHTPQGATWRAISVFKGGSVKVHHDYNNEAGSRNYFASFGQTSGGELWVHDSTITESDVAEDKDRVIQWRRTGAKEWLPGRLLDSQENFVEFDPHIKHHVMPTEGEAWQVVVYTPRGAEKVSADTEKFLKNCGFPGIKSKKRTKGEGGGRPSKKQRNSLANSVGKLSVLFTTLIAAAHSFICEAVQSEVINDPIVLLELGGFEATLEATEMGKAVLEPLSWEDYLDPGVKDKTLHFVKAVTPRHLHLHFGGAPEETHDDLKILVREQTRRRRGSGVTRRSARACRQQPPALPAL